MNFPTCRTCFWFDVDKIKDGELNPQEALEYCRHIYFVDIYFKEAKPDHFFCSEHETKEGQRFVNWGTK